MGIPLHRQSTPATEALEIVADAIAGGAENAGALRRRMVEILCGPGNVHLIQICAGECGHVSVGRGTAGRWICASCSMG